MSHKDHIIIPPDNRLSDKVIDGGPGSVDPDALLRAEQAIQSMEGEYLAWVQADLDKLDAAIATLSASGGGTKDNLQTIFRISHDIKGQGGSFGFDMMTSLGNVLCRLIENMPEAGPQEIDVIQLYITGMKYVIANHIKGIGGAKGEAMLQELDDKKVELLG